jgi:hypothetical protein
MSFFKWSKTAAANASADGTVNWAEGQAPSTVNDSARAMMAAAAKFRDDMGGAIATGGTSAAYTVASNQGFTSLAAMNGMSLAFRPHAANAAGCALNVDGLGAVGLRAQSGVALPANYLSAGGVYVATYINATTEWLLWGAGSDAATLNAPAGTAMLFRQTNAPTGWTKSVSFDNVALRLTTGAVGTGGSLGFTGVFSTSVALGSVTIGTTHLPSYTLPNTLGVSISPNSTGVTAAFAGQFTNSAAAGAVTVMTTGGSTTVAVSDPTHAHSGSITGGVTSGGGGNALPLGSINLNVLYVDVILATKD